MKYFWFGLLVSITLAEREGFNNLRRQLLDILNRAANSRGSEFPSESQFEKETLGNVYLLPSLMLK